MPGAAAPRFVRSSVSGISDTANAVVVDRGDGQRDAVDRDRALLDDVAQQLRAARRSSRRGRSRPRATRATVADAVDVALHDVAAEAVGRAQRQLEVDRVARARARPSEERRSVSCITSAREARRRRSSVAVRQTPLTATESPSRELARRARSATRSRTPSPVGVDARRPCPRSGDQPGEHGSPLPQPRGDQHVVADPLARRASARASPRRSRSAPSPSSGSRALRAAEHDRRDEQADLVDLAGVEERAGQVRAALEQDRGDARARRAGRARSARARARSRRWRRSPRRPAASSASVAGARRGARDDDGQRHLGGAADELGVERQPRLGVEHDARAAGARRPRCGR